MRLVQRGALWLSLLWVAGAQLPLPKIPWLPPPAEQGTAQTKGDLHGAPNPQWANLLGNLLYFYDAQRSGFLPPLYRVNWRNTSATQDGRDAGVDLTGGYYDAGDYMKFTYPLAFTLTSICWGAIDFGAAYDRTNQTTYLDSTLRWGLDWLMKAHPQPDVLYFQVGDADTDNNYWGGDLNIPNFRPSYQINSTHPGTDIASAASAAFSSCSLLYANAKLSSNYSAASLSNSTYANLLATHSKQLLNFAVNATGGLIVHQRSVPTKGRTYASTSYMDDLTFAALWLGLARNSTTLVKAADKYFTDYGLGNDLSVVLNWDSKMPAIPVLFTQMASSYRNLGIDATKWRAQAERYFDAVLGGQSGYLTGGGLLYYDNDSDLASLNPALNAAMLLMRYAPYASTPDKKTAYLNFAKGQLDYALGKNPMSAVYVVGSNPNSPQNPHSAPASGGSDIGNIEYSPPQVAHVIYGGVVGGPNKKDQFFDTRSDWIQNEVALDYSAPLLSLAAMSVLSETSDPFFTSLQAGAYDARRPQARRSCPDPNSPCSEISELDDTGKILLGSFVGVVGLIVVGLELAFVWLWWRSSKTTTKKE